MIMSRLRRNFVPGLPAHLTHRGNNRQVIFRRPADFEVFKHYLKEAVERYAVALNAYVLMNNHVHLMLTPSDVRGISKALHSTSRRYAGYFNARYARTGTLWEGRFGAGLIRAERYLFACYRYIDLNPVRAGIVSRPDQYRWSSHGYYATGVKDELVTPHSLILELSADSSRRQAAYRALFEMPCDPKDYEAIRIASKVGGTIGEKPRARGRPPNEKRT
jgi:putative transposase